MHLRRWFRLLVIGGLLWGFSLITFAFTNDRYVLPTIAVFGAFVVPIAWVVRISERDRPTGVTSQWLAKAFVYGGALGFVSSALLETPFVLVPPVLFSVSVGLIEEGSKIVALVWITRHLRPKSAEMGFVLGAAVGFGFEALEDAGYGLSILDHTDSWSAVVNTQLTRATSTPVTHGLWTAIVGAVLFHQSCRPRFRVTSSLTVVFAAVTTLHTLWDLTPNIGLTLDEHCFGHNLSPSVVNDSWSALLGFIGVLVARRVRRRFCSNGTSRVSLKVCSTAMRHANRRASPSR